MNKLEKFWDFIANSYDESEKQFEQIHQKTIENTIMYLKPTDIVLDYGCATGTKSLILARNVKKIHGIDISSKMIDIAKSKAFEQKIENIDFLKAILFDEKVKKESFDVILVFNILHTLKDGQKVMQRIAELLKPGGLIIMTTPCLKEKMSPWHRFKFSPFLLLSKIGIIPNLKRFTFSELDDLITNENFQIIETEKLFQGMSSYFIVAKKIIL